MRADDHLVADERTDSHQAHERGDRAEGACPGVAMLVQLGCGELHACLVRAPGRSSGRWQGRERVE